MTLTQEYLKECLHYDPETGLFTWLNRPIHHFRRESNGRGWNTNYSGTQAGTVDGKGYVQINLGGKLHRAHRLAFLYMDGGFPENEVDHVNHIKLDNRWVNLHKATVSENRRNQTLSKASTCGVTGVYWNRKTEKWVGQIKFRNKVKYLGSFDHFDDAVAARKVAEQELNFHVNHGAPAITTAG